MLRFIEVLRFFQCRDPVGLGLFSQDVPPVLENGDYVLFVVKEDNIFFIAVSKNEVSPMLAIEFIKRIISLFRAYINNVSETKIRSNFSLIYQVGVSGCADI